MASKTEIWKEAGVLEVEVPEHHSMDIEEIAVNLKDEYANAYLKSMIFMLFCCHN